MEPVIERINLSDGGWWEIRAEVTRGMRKVFQAAAFKAISGGLDGQSDLTDPEIVKTLTLAHPERLELFAIDDAFLLHGTVAWSYEESVSLEMIDALPDSVVEQVLVRMRELYAEPIPERLKN